MLDFLAHVFYKGYEYRTTSRQRSAISAYHDYRYTIEAVAVCIHLQVCALIAVSLTRNPQIQDILLPWDVQVTLDYIQSNWAVSKELTMKDLFYKLVTLLVLTSALQDLDVRSITANPDYAKFVS